MFCRLILKAIISLNLLVASAAAQQVSEGARLPAGFVLIEPNSVPISIKTVSTLADEMFEATDNDGGGTIDLTELKAWRDTTDALDGEDTLAAVLDLETKGMLQSADQNGDDALTATEVRALALYDFAVHDSDGDGVLISDEIVTWQPTLLQWASRPCLEFGVEEGMLLGAFCGR